MVVDEGKSQARKSYCREWFLLPVELISPWWLRITLSLRRTDSSDSTLMLAISNRWSLNAWSLFSNTSSCCQACTFLRTTC